MLRLPRIMSVGRLLDVKIKENQWMKWACDVVFVALSSCWGMRIQGVWRSLGQMFRRLHEGPVLNCTFILSVRRGSFLVNHVADVWE